MSLVFSSLAVVPVYSSLLVSQSDRSLSAWPSVVVVSVSILLSVLVLVVVLVSSGLRFTLSQSDGQLVFSLLLLPQVLPTISLTAGTARPI